MSAAQGQPATVAGYDCGACTDLPKGKMPILVLTDRGYAANPFGCYLIEILRGEGLVEYEHAERSVLLAAADADARLSAYQVIVLAQMNPSASERDRLRKYVEGGGVLVAMRPNADLAELFGIRVVGIKPEKVLQYFAIDTRTAPGRGIVDVAMQYHGETTEYALQGATALASLGKDVQKPSNSPAATKHRLGRGWAVAFAFDLPKSIALMRQGNPEWQNTEGDGRTGYRPTDMYMRLDGTRYFDPGLFPIPQADETQRFLANIVAEMCERPLPRMWYLPGMHKVLMVNTGDGENNYGKEFDSVLDTCANYGGRFSLYLRGRVNAAKELGIERTTAEQEVAWRKVGHEIGVHVWAGGPDGKGAYEALHDAYGKIVGDLRAKFGHGSRTCRNHSIDWTGWVDMAAIEAEFGTGMDFNYYHLIFGHSPKTTNGYFNGTGLPQRFIDAKGRILPIYQATTQWADEWFATRGEDMTAKEVVAVIKRMFEAGRQGYYSAFVNNIHPARYNDGKDITSAWAKVIWAYCREEGVPSWSGEMLLDFVEARNRAQFQNLIWEAVPSRAGRQLKFDFQGTEGQDLTVMVPASYGGHELTKVAVDKKTVPLTIETIKGIRYAMFTPKTARAQVVADYAGASH